MTRTVERIPITRRFNPTIPENELLYTCMTARFCIYFHFMGNIITISEDFRKRYGYDI